MSAAPHFVPSGKLDALEYDPDIYGAILSRLGVPLVVVWNVFVDGDTLYNWYSIETPASTLVSAGGYPTEGAAWAVARHWEDLRERHFAKDQAARDVDLFRAEANAAADCFGMASTPAPDWHEAYAEVRWG